MAQPVDIYDTDENEFYEAQDELRQLNESDAKKKDNMIGCMTDEAAMRPITSTMTVGAQPTGNKRKRPSVDSIRITNALFMTYPQFSVELPDLQKVKAELKAKLDTYADSDSGIIAREKHEDGHYHLHVYWHFKATSDTATGTRTILHKDLVVCGKRGNYQAPRSNVAVMKYTKKDGDYIWWGQDPKGIDQARKQHSRIVPADLLAGKHTVNEFVDANPNELKNLTKWKSNLNTYRADQKQRRNPPHVLWLQGPSGIGKTQLARSHSSTMFEVPLAATGQTWWMDGYSGEDVILFDNISHDFHPQYDWLLRVMDAGNCVAQTKGGMIPITASRIIVTSTLSPHQVWKDQCDQQILRRLSVWQKLDWNMDGTDVVFETQDLAIYKKDCLAPSVQKLIDDLRAKQS